MTAETQQLENSKNNKETSIGPKLMKARFTDEEVSLIEELKKNKGILADSKVLKYIVNDYFKQQLGTNDIVQKQEGASPSAKAKIKRLETELVELKETNLELTNENKQLLTNLSDLPLEDKLKNYSRQILDVALNKTTRYFSHKTSIHEVRLECRNIPNELFNLHHHEIVELYEDAFEKGYKTRREDLEAVIDELELSNLMIVNKNELISAFQKSSVSSFSFIQRNDHKIDSVNFAKWYKKELKSILTNIEAFSSTISR